MKILTWAARILVGVLFIVSGMIKANDPLGFSYKLNDYFEVFAADLSPEQDHLDLYIIQDGDTAIHQERPFSTNDSLLNIRLKVEHVMPDTAAGEILDTAFMEYRVTSIIKGRTEEAVHFAPEEAEFQYIIQTGNEELHNGKISLAGGEDIQETLELVVYDHVKQVNLLVNFFNWLPAYSLYLSMFISILEVVLGIALIMGVYSSFTAWILLLMILFFSFLTLYSAYFDKVTDCGCFGDALKITPWQSFYKDIVLLALILVIFIRRKFIRPNTLRMDMIALPVSLVIMAIFSAGVLGWWFPVFFTAFLFILFAVIKIFLKPRASSGIIAFATLSVVIFTIWTYHHLPIADFRPYAAGKDICEQMKLPPDAKEQIAEILFIYEHKETGEQVEIPSEDFGSSVVAQNKDDYKYVDRTMKIIQEADVAPIESFPIDDDEGNDIHDSILNLSGYKFLVVAYDLDKTKTKRWERINDLQHNAEQSGIPFFGLTSSTGQKEAFRHEHQAAFPFYSGDAIILKTVVRSNPGLVLMKDCEVVDKWHWRDIPKWEDLGLE